MTVEHTHDTETDFVTCCMEALGFDHRSWSLLSGSEQADLLTYMREARKHTVIRNP